MNLKNNKIAIVLSVILLGIVAVVFMKSTTGKTVEAPRTFVDVSGQKIILELYNAPDGFLAALLAEDTLGLIETDQGVIEKSEKDNLVYFLESWDDLDSLSGDYEAILKNASRDVGRRHQLLRFTLYPEGQIGQIHLVNMGAYKGSSSEAILCRSVKYIYNSMQYFRDDFDRKNSIVMISQKDIFHDCR